MLEIIHQCLLLVVLTSIGIVLFPIVLAVPMWELFLDVDANVMIALTGVYAAAVVYAMIVTSSMIVTSMP
jgi:hypothetical protein